MSESSDLRRRNSRHSGDENQQVIINSQRDSSQNSGLDSSHIVDHQSISDYSVRSNKEQGRSESGEEENKMQECSSPRSVHECSDDDEPKLRVRKQNVTHTISSLPLMRDIIRIVRPARIREEDPAEDGISQKRESGSEIDLEVCIILSSERFDKFKKNK